jgi:hypothetical protein
MEEWPGFPAIRGTPVARFHQGGGFRPGVVDQSHAFREVVYTTAGADRSHSRTPAANSI